MSSHDGLACNAANACTPHGGTCRYAGFLQTHTHTYTRANIPTHTDTQTHTHTPTPTQTPPPLQSTHMISSFWFFFLFFSISSAFLIPFISNYFPGIFYFPLFLVRFQRLLGEKRRIRMSDSWTPSSPLPPSSPSSPPVSFPSFFCFFCIWPIVSHHFSFPLFIFTHYTAPFTVTGSKYWGQRTKLQPADLLDGDR